MKSINLLSFVVVFFRAKKPFLAGDCSVLPNIKPMASTIEMSRGI
jgi:hypothetical protein